MSCCHVPIITVWTLLQRGSKVSTNWSNTWKHACYCAFMYTFTGKHVCFHVISLFSAHFWPHWKRVHCVNTQLNIAIIVVCYLATYVRIYSNFLECMAIGKTSYNRIPLKPLLNNKLVAIHKYRQSSMSVQMLLCLWIVPNFYLVDVNGQQSTLKYILFISV